MNELIIVIVIICVVLAVFMYYEKQYSELMYVESSLDNRKYLVRNHDTKQDAANLLAKLIGNLDTLIAHLKEEGIFTRLTTRYNKNNISESLTSSKYTSYSVNKGEKLVFCIRNKDPLESLVNLNTITFVAIHELAHIETISVGHTKEFWDNMRELLKVGIKLGIYTQENYESNPVEYCGISITDSPLS